jgi:hypothetical protein
MFHFGAIGRREALFWRGQRCRRRNRSETGVLRLLGGQSRTQALKSCRTSPPWAPIPPGRAPTGADRVERPSRGHVEAVRPVGEGEDTNGERQRRKGAAGWGRRPARRRQRPSGGRGTPRRAHWPDCPRGSSAPDRATAPPDHPPPPPGEPGPRLRALRQRRWRRRHPRGAPRARRRHRGRRSRSARARRRRRRELQRLRRRRHRQLSEEPRGQAPHWCAARFDLRPFPPAGRSRPLGPSRHELLPTAPPPRAAAP